MCPRNYLSLFGLGKLRRYGIVEPIVGVQSIIPQVLEECAVELICARPRYD